MSSLFRHRELTMMISKINSDTRPAVICQDASIRIHAAERSSMANAQDGIVGHQNSH
jgi:hypothetical protein